MDALTVAFLVLAVYLLLQPRSFARVAWNEYRADQMTSMAAQRLWSDIVEVSSPLFRDEGGAQIVEISDYECPFCRLASAVVDSAIAAGLRVAYLQLPRPSNPRAMEAAVAALCAEASDRFPEMHDRLMNSSEWREDLGWAREAQLAGVPVISEFEACLRSAHVRQRLSRQRALAESLRISATPTFVSRKSVHRGTLSMNQLLGLDH